MLYRHSWGGSAMIELAREPEIPVLLAGQVDTVRRFGVVDRVIAPNVARAANLHPPDGMVHSREEIRVSQILGNFRFEYNEHPIHCREYPWYDRTFAKTPIACDSAAWSRVEALIRQQVASASAKQD